jgi:hypothetical protein
MLRLAAVALALLSALMVVFSCSDSAGGAQVRRLYRVGDWDFVQRVSADPYRDDSPSGLPAGLSSAMRVQVGQSPQPLGDRRRRQMGHAPLAGPARPAGAGPRVHPTPVTGRGVKGTHRP